MNLLSWLWTNKLQRPQHYHFIIAVVAPSCRMSFCCPPPRIKLISEGQKGRYLRRRHGGRKLQSSQTEPQCNGGFANLAAAAASEERRRRRRRL